MNASIRRRPDLTAAKAISSASAASRASGFSHSTCLPEARARSVQGLWRLLGRGMYTASTSGRASTAS